MKEVEALLHLGRWPVMSHRDRHVLRQCYGMPLHPDYADAECDPAMRFVSWLDIFTAKLTKSARSHTMTFVQKCRMSRYLESRYVLVVESLAPATRASDVRWEMEAHGPVRRCERDRGMKLALVEFDRCVLVGAQALVRSCAHTRTR